MDKRMHSFGETAQKLTRNPLGLLGLFLILVYGLACLVTVLVESLTVTERLPFVYFLTLFPVLVLIAFLWLVTKHNHKLYGPGDYANQEDFIKLQLSTAHLGAATAETQGSATALTGERIAESTRAARSALSHAGSSLELLWVDDKPSNNAYERRAFEAIGISVHSSLTTDDAIGKLAGKSYDAIISDMSRPGEPRAGYLLLDEIRRLGNRTPLFFYTSSNEPKHRDETLQHGGQGSTNDPWQLFVMVVKELLEVPL